MSDTGAQSTPDLLEVMHRDLGTTIGHILGHTELLQDQAEELGQETFLPDLQKVHGVAKHLTGLIHELLGDGAMSLEEVDFPRLRFEIRTALNHTIGYVEMLQEKACEMGLSALVPDLDNAHRLCRQLVTQMEAAAQAAGAGAGPSAASIASAEEGLQIAANLVPAKEPAPMPPTLLVVDDNIQNRDLLGRQLRSLGYRVVPAGSGPSAMERLSAETFDLVLLDVVMPGMNGYEVLQWIKADEGLREIPVLMIAAMNDTENVVRCVAIGADDYVTKPFDPVLLKVRVNACLERIRWRKLEESYQRQIAEGRAEFERILVDMLPKSTVV